MPRKLVLALAITNLFACSHTYKSEASSFINKPLSTQKEVKPSVPATVESAQLPQGTAFKTTTQPAIKLNQVVSPTTKVAEIKIATATKTDLIGTSNETIPTNGIKKVAELSTAAVPKVKQSDNAVSSLPTIFNDQHSHAKSKICLDTSRLAKNRSTLHPNWDSLKKIEVNKAIFKQLFIHDPLADEIAALNNIWFNGDKVETFDNFKEKVAEKRDNAPKQTPKTRSRTTIKLHRNYKNYRSLVQKIAKQTQVDAALLHAVIQAESSYNPRARSPRGAVGLMQLMPATARRFGAKNLTDPTTNVYAGARYLRYLLKLFNNNKKLALAGYNAGEYAVKRHGNKIPPYRQTRRYVNKVMSLYEAHRNNM